MRPKTMTPSRLRAENKKKYAILPTGWIHDPFIGKSYYINANGRVVVKGENGMLKALEQCRGGKK